jgi:hypothetical protein
MTWPQATDYNAAVQNPQLCFRDDDLRQGQAVGDLLGLPCPHSGNFADVYQIRGADNQSWAVKCFTRRVANLHQRYQAISEHLRQTQRAFMVEFHFREEGICIHGQWYPLVKMRWVEGFRLNEFVRDHLDKPVLLERLAQMWIRLAQELRDAQMAHGDLQHGNVLLVPGSKSSSLALRLIDYDGMFVPSLAATPSGEVGHPNYQHPQRLREGGYDTRMDAFAHLLIYTALRCLRVGGAELWQQYDNGENLLFREDDFRTPDRSRLLRELWQGKDRDTRDLVGHLLLASRGPLCEVPLLDELVEQSIVRPLSGAAEARVNGLLGDAPLSRTERIVRAVPTMAAIEIASEHVATLAEPSAAPTQTIALDATAPHRPTPPPLPRSFQRNAAAVGREHAPATGRRGRDLSALVDPVVAILSRPAWLAALGTVALLSFLVVNVLVWSSVKPPAAPSPTVHNPSLLPIDFVTLKGGHRGEVALAVDRDGCTEPLTIRVDGLPADMRPSVLTLAPDQDTVALPLLAPLDIAVPPHDVLVSLWKGGERLQETLFRMEVQKVARPLLRQPDSIHCRAGTEYVFGADVDRRDCGEPLHASIEGLPPAIQQESRPGQGDQPPRVKLRIAADARPQELIPCSLVLRVGDVVADTKPLFLIIQKAIPSVRLKKSRLPDAMTVRAGGKGELLVLIERGEFKGPVEVQLRGQPAGVTIAPVTVRPEVSFATLMVEVKREMEPGQHTLKLQAAAEGQMTDEREITLTIEAQPAPAARQRKGDGEAERVSFATLDGVELVGTLYPGAKGKQGACILMLTELGRTQSMPGWVRLAKALQAEGHTVLTFDFRGHGESKRVRAAFWQFGVNQQLPAHRKVEREKPLPETIEAGDLPPSYLPWLVHDVSAARMFLDTRHDDPASPINSYNVLLFGAGSGATIGSLWLATEGFRFNALRPGVAIKPDWVRNHDVVRAVWLGINRTWRDVEYPLTSWIRTAYRPHPERDPNAVVPMEFLFGAEDVDTYRLVSELVAGGVGDSRPILGAHLAGMMLLEKDRVSERSIRTYLLDSLKKMRLRAWSPRRLDMYRSFWGIPNPNGQQMDFYLAKRPSEHVLRQIPLARFSVRMPGLPQPRAVRPGEAD